MAANGVNGINNHPTSVRAQEYYRTIAEKHPFPSDTPGYRNGDTLAYELSRVPFRTARPLKIICCGAGLSGLNLAHEVHSGGIENCDLTVYEKNSSLGGTWFENAYPGCACDIPIHNYQYSWAPFPHFSSFYSSQKEIYKYMLAVAENFNLNQYIKTSHKIIGAKWIAERAKWQIQVVKTDGRERVVSDNGVHEGEAGEPFFEECDVFINASGAWNHWRWPAVPGRSSFKGNMLHSAAWNNEVDLTGQTVILIGNGSSGIQILPSILDKVKKIYVVTRSKTWVTPPLANRFASGDGKNRVFTKEEKETWASDSTSYLQYRKEVEQELNARFRLYIKDSELSKMIHGMTVKTMTDRVAAKPELADLLIPDFDVGCRRPTPGTGYLEALCSDKCEIIRDTVINFTETGLEVSSGLKLEADTIICATGYNMGFVPRFPIIGSHGRDLRDDWTEDLPTCYLSVTVRSMPNYLVYMGPTSPLGHGSVVGSVEHVTGYMRKILRKLQTENYVSFVPKDSVTRAWLNHAQKWMRKTVWVEDCASSFKNGRSSGPVVSLHPGSRLHYFDLLANPRYEDFEWTSLCADEMDMFAWLGDGFLTGETYGTMDLAYYVEEAPAAPLVLGERDVFG